MSTSFEKYQKRRLKSSYFSVILSIAFVLFLLGLFGLLVLNTKKVSDYFKEQSSITIFLKDNADQQKVKNLQTLLESEPYTKSITYISKDEAAKIAIEENGEDFMEFLGYNPLKNAYDLFIKADYVSPEKMTEIEKNLAKNEVVYEVSYDKPLIDLLTKNIKRISLWVLVFSSIFVFIAMLLINNSIRLSVYSKRFTIKTMQLVGATKRFIRKPFVWSSIKLGALGALVALVALAIAMYYLNINFPEFGFLENKELLAILFISIFLMGIIISWISAFFATQRFLNLRTDQLYY
ncbi:ABC transporter permease [Aureibaculum marinum]|uniref:Cell division protein FtsX n=1 Tax=Aureibaculum marinum TaxID=2487930 RepID=A0A3N4NMZ2_9FLAO|nr:permease-like cell division protein FtsX [Aureibaculum marinum]RPD97762.1 ABC transporter permease [Aureibaculum marinum]